MYSYEQGQELYDELKQINTDLKANAIDLKTAAELNNNCGKRVMIHRNQIVWYQVTNRIGVTDLSEAAQQEPPELKKVNGKKGKKE